MFIHGPIPGPDLTGASTTSALRNAAGVLTELRQRLASSKAQQQQLVERWPPRQLSFVFSEKQAKHTEKFWVTLKRLFVSKDWWSKKLSRAYFFQISFFCTIFFSDTVFRLNLESSKEVASETWYEDLGEEIENHFALIFLTHKSCKGSYMNVLVDLPY